MANKRQLRHFWAKIRGVSHWYFFAGFVAFAVIGVFALRQNNLTAIHLRDELLKVDEEGGDVEGSLRNLREFVYSHMNADLSTGTGVQQPVQLKYSYERLVAAEKARVEKANENVYTAAQKYCESKYPGSFSGGPRVPCIRDYVTNNGVKEQPVPDDFYKFSFASPRWSPDLAGISILLAGIFLVVFIIRFVLERWLKLELTGHL